MNTQTYQTEEISVTEILPNKVIKKESKKPFFSFLKLEKNDKTASETPKSARQRDVLDFVIIQTAIACGILTILLAVNLITTGNVSQLVSILGL